MEKTILVIDDFENSLFVTAFTLQNKGYKVLKANSGQKAIEHLNGQKIDLIITDYNMPQMNGLELVEKVKQDARYNRLPIFVLSTEIREEIKSNARKLGVTLWIKKPFKMEQLLNYVEKTINIY